MPNPAPRNDSAYLHWRVSNVKPILIGVRTHLVLLESGARLRALLLGLLNGVQKGFESRFMLLVLFGQFLRCSLVQPEFFF